MLLCLMFVMVVKQYIHKGAAVDSVFITRPTTVSIPNMVMVVVHVDRELPSMVQTSTLSTMMPQHRPP